ncbi:MAG TPA: PH domain-containing protein [Bellilinea sp.]|nr:PH domain-containing protein [Bellilinea sp.]
MSTLEEYQSRIKSAIWLAISKSGVDLSAISAQNQSTLVDSISSEGLKLFDELMNETQAKVAEVPAATPSTDDDHTAETVLWEGRPFLSLVENYVITSERIRISTGLLGKEYENYELIRVQDIDITQSMSERMLDLGDIHVRGADPSKSEVILRNINQPQEVYELLRKAWLEVRKKYNLLFREEM